ncbi:efflux RND transporter periplasmic adaptor subunit [Persephonella sp.]
MNWKNLAISIAVFIFGIGIGVFIQIGDKIEPLLKRLFQEEKKEIQSAKLPESKNSSGILTVEQLFNIDTTVAVYKDIQKHIETYGELVHPETDIRDITFKINGYVEELYADYTGKYIKKGEPLLTVYSPELVSAQEELLRAYEYLNGIKNSQDRILKQTAENMYEAAYKKLLYWDITPKQIENLKKTKKVMKTLTLYSPYDGWIMEKFVNLGSKVEAGKPVLRIAKHENLWLLAKIYEHDLPFVKKGQKVMIHFESYPDKMFHGIVDYIYPMMDIKNRTVNVRIILPNPEYELTPGMYSNIHIKVPVGKLLVLPETAVINTGKRQIVFVQKEKGVFEPAFVKFGRYIEGYYEILEGLHAGMTVANSALFLLDADAQLKGKYSKDGQQKSMEMMHHHH